MNTTDAVWVEVRGRQRVRDVDLSVTRNRRAQAETPLPPGVPVTSIHADAREVVGVSGGGCLAAAWHVARQSQAAGPAPAAPSGVVPPHPAHVRQDRGRCRGVRRWRGRREGSRPRHHADADRDPDARGALVGPQRAPVQGAAAAPGASSG